MAVKRDRAMESLLPVGASFVLNVLAEGREKSMMKQVGLRGWSDWLRAGHRHVLCRGGRPAGHWPWLHVRRSARRLCCLVD